MRRIYANFADEEYKVVEEAAQKVGITISAYCKTAVMEKVLGKTDPAQELIMKLHEKLLRLSPGATFIVSDLYPKEEWRVLSRATKNTIAQQLTKFVRENPELYAVNQVLPGKIKQYKKL